MLTEAEKDKIRKNVILLLSQPGHTTFLGDRATGVFIGSRLDAMFYAGSAPLRYGHFDVFGKLAGHPITDMPDLIMLIQAVLEP